MIKILIVIKCVICLISGWKECASRIRHRQFSLWIQQEYPRGNPKQCNLGYLIQPGQRRSSNDPQNRSECIFITRRRTIFQFRGSKSIRNLDWILNVLKWAILEFPTRSNPRKLAWNITEQYRDWELATIARKSLVILYEQHLFPSKFDQWFQQSQLFDSKEYILT